MKFILCLSQHGTQDKQLLDKVSDVFIHYVPGLVQPLTNLILMSETSNRHVILVIFISLIF